MYHERDRMPQEEALSELGSARGNHEFWRAQDKPWRAFYSLFSERWGRNTEESPHPGDPIDRAVLGALLRHWPAIHAEVLTELEQAERATHRDAIGALQELLYDLQKGGK